MLSHSAYINADGRNQGAVELIQRKETGFKGAAALHVDECRQEKSRCCRTVTNRRNQGAVAHSQRKTGFKRAVAMSQRKKTGLKYAFALEHSWAKP